MVPSFDNEVRAGLAEALGAVLGVAFDARRIRLPARHADASVYLPREVEPDRALHLNDVSFWGVALVSCVRLENGWLLISFSDAFFSALIERINAALPLPQHDGGKHAINRMLALARHGGEGCPPVPAMKRALLEALFAHNSSAAYRKAARAAETLLSAVLPRKRPALLDQSGALGGAIARLLFDAL